MLTKRRCDDAGRLVLIPLCTGVALHMVGHAPAVLAPLRPCSVPSLALRTTPVIRRMSPGLHILDRAYIIITILDCRYGWTRDRRVVLYMLESTRLMQADACQILSDSRVAVATIQPS